MHGEIREALDRVGVDYKYNERLNAFTAGAELPTKIEGGDFAIILSEASIIGYVFRYDFEYNETKKNELAEYICRINDSVLFGHFNIDFEEKAISYVFNTYIIHDTDFIEKQIEGVLDTALQYADGIADVNEGVCTPKEAAELAMENLEEDL